MLRSLFFVGIVGPILIASLVWPHVGILMWEWFSLQNPHREIYGFISDLPFNQIIAGFTVIGFLFAADKKRMPFTGTSFILIVALPVLLTISTYMGLTPAKSWPAFDRTMKILLFAAMILFLVNRKSRIHAFVWIFALSLGYYGVMSGLRFFASGGAQGIHGPEGTMIGDRNHLALAMVMALPLMHYLHQQSRLALIRLALIGTMLITVFAVIGTYSRGGFVALAAAGGLLWWKSRRKLTYAAVLTVLGSALLTVAPEAWLDRIAGMESAAADDGSFQGRLVAWQVYFNAGVDRPFTGVGLYGLQDWSAFKRYFTEEALEASGLAEFDKALAAHSIYFQLIGETGFLTFGAYILMVLGAWRNCDRMIQVAKTAPTMRWLVDLGNMLQVSLFAFLIGGAALSLAYYDGFLILIALTVCARDFAERFTADQERLAADHGPAARYHRRGTAGVRPQIVP